MNTTTFAPGIATVTRICTVCQQPANEEQGLVRELVGYIHPDCSNNHYEFVTAVSVPHSNEDPEPDPTTPSPANALTGLQLCADCNGLHDPFDLCENCQQLCNEWDSNHASDYDRQYERFLSDRYYGILAA